MKSIFYCIFTNGGKWLLTKTISITIHVVESMLLLGCLALLVFIGLPDGTYIFKQKILIWVNFEGYCNARCWYTYFITIWYILRPFGIVYGHLVYFMTIWYILRPFGIFCGHFVYFVTIWYMLRPFGII
jgi:hypothetical protein